MTVLPSTAFLNIFELLNKKYIVKVTGDLKISRYYMFDVIIDDFSPNYITWNKYRQ